MNRVNNFVNSSVERLNQPTLPSLKDCGRMLLDVVDLVYTYALPLLFFCTWYWFRCFSLKYAPESLRKFNLVVRVVESKFALLSSAVVFFGIKCLKWGIFSPQNKSMSPKSSSPAPEAIDHPMQHQRDLENIEGYASSHGSEGSHFGDKNYNLDPQLFLRRPSLHLGSQSERSHHREHKKRGKNDAGSHSASPREIPVRPPTIKPTPLRLHSRDISPYSIVSGQQGARNSIITPMSEREQSMRSSDMDTSFTLSNTFDYINIDSKNTKT